MDAHPELFDLPVPCRSLLCSKERTLGPAFACQCVPGILELHFVLVHGRELREQDERYLGDLLRAHVPDPDHDHWSRHHSKSQNPVAPVAHARRGFDYRGLLRCVINLVGDTTSLFDFRALDELDNIVENRIGGPRRDADVPRELHQAPGQESISFCSVEDS